MNFLQFPSVTSSRRITTIGYARRLSLSFLLSFYTSSLSWQHLDDDLGVSLSDNLLGLLEEFQSSLFSLRSGHGETIRTGQRLSRNISNVSVNHSLPKSTANKTDLSGSIEGSQ
jgi:hypothetical protein